MPCLDEAETLAACVAEARPHWRPPAIAGEVVVADNGSTDGSQALAAAAGARVVEVADARLRQRAGRRASPRRAAGSC